MLPHKCDSHVSWPAEYCQACQTTQIIQFGSFVSNARNIPAYAEMSGSALVGLIKTATWSKTSTSGLVQYGIISATSDLPTMYILEYALRQACTATGVSSIQDTPAWAQRVISTYLDGWDVSGSYVADNDRFCAECDIWVSCFDPSAKRHFDSICQSCSQHRADCGCCGNCGESPCACCDICGGNSNYCGCCADCGEEYCSCHNDEYEESYSSYGAWGTHGPSGDAPWLQRASLETPLSDILDKADIDKDIDPVQAAADFYLLSSMRDMVRWHEVSFKDEESQLVWMSAMSGMIERHDMLSAVRIGADRALKRLVSSLDASFRAYGLSAVGGELRHHRKTGKAGCLDKNRKTAWADFANIVREYGVEVLFDAGVLFEEFSGGSYGGPKWANAARIVGKRLSGEMPDWAFVDRTFTLQHNGGCFLNKVTWSTKNTLGYGLSHMNYVLNAHSGHCSGYYPGSDCSCEQCTKGETDWFVLLETCSPYVRQMFEKADSYIMRLCSPMGGKLRSAGKYGSDRSARASRSIYS